MALFDNKRDDGIVACARRTAAAGQTYLVPLQYEEFRLATGLPIFVDTKSHPYKDTEIVEWSERMRLAGAFYEAPDAAEAAAALAAIERRQKITHVVAPVAMKSALAAQGLQELTRGEKDVLFAIAGAGRPVGPACR